MITAAKLLRPADKLPEAPRGSAEYSIDAPQLLQFGLSPRRWVERAPADDPEETVTSNLVRLFSLAPDETAARYIMRPREYTAHVNTCPKCGSVGVGKLCRKDASRRRIVPTQKPWSGSATFCVNWQIQQEKLKKQVVNPDRWDEASTAAGRLLSDPDVASLWEQSDKLQLYAGCYHDPDSGLDIPVHGLVDLVPRSGETLDRALAQVVVTRDVSPSAWSRSVWYGGRYVEASLLRELHGAATGDPRPHFLWCMVESSPPHLTGRRRAAAELLLKGNTLLLKLLAAYAACLKSGEWPAFDTSAPGQVTAWSEVFVDNWMTQGVGGEQAYYALTLPATAAP